MYCRTKISGGRTYLQIAESRREGKKVRQRVICTLGRLDRLTASGALDRLVQSVSRHSEKLLVLSEATDRSVDASSRVIGPGLLFEPLWRDTGCGEILREALEGRGHGFDVERAVFASVLHRIMVSGSDRQAHRWMQDQVIPGAEELQLQHLYRAMAWLGEPEDGEGAEDADRKFGPRCVKDWIEEQLFAHRRDLYTGLDMVFFDTTSLYFHGEGGKTLGRHGKSKDFRPHCRQMVVGMVLDGDGYPVCSQIWPGNTADVATLDRVAQRLQTRFGLGSVCVVADRGMISKATLAAIEARGWQYILGARHRSSKEIREIVLNDPAPFESVAMERAGPTPLQLGVKEVTVSGAKDAEATSARRYIVCRNPVQARKDTATREAIVEDLRKKLAGAGAKSLVANRGYKRYLRGEKDAFEIDEEKILSEARFDGIWVLQTNTDFTPKEAAAKYKSLWMVEQIFRTAKGILDTRPIFHRRDETIRGHVFCSFLALLLQSELRRRMEVAGIEAEWADILRNLNALTETEIAHENKRFLVRSAAKGNLTAILRCAGARLPQTIRMLDSTERKP